jgi:hypothetical protein
MENNYIVADWINHIHFAYTCPDCSFNNNKKKLIQHRHGSSNNISNRIESRSRHCCKTAGDIDIIINESTIRK